MVLLLGKEGWLHIIGKDIQNVFQNIFKQRSKWRREVDKYVSFYYTEDAVSATNSKKIVICMVDGKMHHGGLGDRLRGIISVYYICSKLNIPFKIYFISPFRLQDFLMPNVVDWEIDDKDICYNKKDAIPVFCGTNGTHVEKPFQERWLTKRIKENVKQIHIYTNAHLKEGRQFHLYFNRLFKMSPTLKDLVDKVKAEIGSNYIAVTCRFQQLLGDFKEGNYATLQTAEQQKLIDVTLCEIERIYTSQKSSNKLPILLTSDSVRFLNYATTKLIYVYRVPGNLVHMDYSTVTDSKIHMKSFADLMMISGADYVYLIKSRDMYNSGFPRIAALIGNKPFKLIRF